MIAVLIRCLRSESRAARVAGVVPIVLVALACWFADGAAAAKTVPPAVPVTVAPQRLIVVSSADTQANARAIDGIRRAASFAVDTLRIGQDDAALSAAIASAPPGTAIVALGSRAAQFVAQLPTRAPTVDCMVAGDVNFQSAAPVVPLAVPVDLQIRWIRQLMPATRTVAILYDPSQNRRIAADAAAQLTAAGYKVMSEAVASPAELPPALARIGPADALLALPDSTVYSPELAKGILLFTYRTRTPMIAFSDAWVRAGALYSLEWDYAELGAYCAALALHQMSTARNASPPAMPRPHVTVNTAAAAQLQLKWDAASLAGVEHVHE